MTVAEASTKWMVDPDREWGPPYWAVATWQGFADKIRRLKVDRDKDDAETIKQKRADNKVLKKLFGRFDVMIFDEAHIAGAKVVHEVCNKFPAKYLLRHRLPRQYRLSVWLCSARPVPHEPIPA